MNAARTSTRPTLLAALLLAPSAVAAGGPADELHALLTAHCADCHNADLTEGEFDLTNLLDGAGDDAPSDAARGRAVVRMWERVQAGEMPPPEFELIDDAERTRVIAALEAERGRLTERLRDDPGAPAMTRLTRYEYRNVFRDLSGGAVTRAGRFLPNEGGAGEGFANVGAAQTMTPPLFESYVDAAKDALRHLRLYPADAGWSDGAGMDGAAANGDPAVVWSPVPRAPVATPREAIKEATDDVIAWYVAQQQAWGEEHREELAARLGFVHAAYLEAAYRFHRRTDRDAEIAAFASAPLDPNRPVGDRVPLSPAALRTWIDILTTAEQSSPHRGWAEAWRTLAEENEPTPAELRRRCAAIVSGKEAASTETGDYAPPYEISFREAKEETLRIAREENRWPFRIEIGDADELFLLITDGGDGNRGEDMMWRGGRFLFRDGSAEPWQEVTAVRGASSGREFPWGVDANGAKTLPADAVGARPPAALKVAVPAGASLFEVELALAPGTDRASVQGLVLREKPKNSRYVRDRAVFGGRPKASASGTLSPEQKRALKKRNVAEANRTKIGLNAERNVFADWT
ncbi:MAG: DUF1587 domain-containing protein, partial [Planctomycetota bacterium]